MLFTACSEKEGGNEGGEPDPVEATLTVTPATLEFAEEGETLAFKVTTNVAWTVTTNADWLDLSAGSGNAGENLTVEATAEANETGEERSAVITVKAGELSKAVTVAQGFIEEEEPVTPPVDQNTTYKVDGDKLRYADDLADGALYVFVYSYDTGKAWTVSDNKLTMADYNPSAVTPSQVFEYTLDESKIDTSFDTYSNWSAGAMKSLATGKYLDEEFNATASAVDALYLMFANNWGGYEGNEVNVMDIYHSSSTAGSVLTLWYYNNGFEWGDMGLYKDVFTNYQTLRKAIVYKVVANE